MWSLIMFLVIAAAVTALVLFMKKRAKCWVFGHQWHEGEDTFHVLHQWGSFRNGGYIWRCQRCGAETKVGDPPPEDHRWDHTWCSPIEDRFGKKEHCFRVYRKRQQETEGGTSRAFFD